MQFKTTRPLGRTIHAGFAALGSAALVLSVGACSSQPQPEGAASENASSELVITAPWSRETAKGQDAGGAFMTIANEGSGADRLTGGSTPVAGDTVTLKPGSFHIMLMDLKHPLERGETVPLTLTFEKAGPVEVELIVEPVGSQGPDEAGGGDE